ncbi:hypothetical protein OS493_029001 [Desmophyllum pertusum]|uniref:Uncharacterized protein n=1 Tax=Desmophyllum pertusum TaxID=174260 RepID=A0A9W9YX01_9CNID|nr:hypothetical protein OS493_029001 [Desmophyllum pertusum]
MERNVVPVHNNGKRGMQMRDQDVDRNVELTSNNNGKRVMQERRDSQYEETCACSPVSWTVIENFKRND